MVKPIANVMNETSKTNKNISNFQKILTLVSDDNFFELGADDDPFGDYDGFLLALRNDNSGKFHHVSLK